MSRGNRGTIGRDAWGESCQICYSNQTWIGSSAAWKDCCTSILRPAETGSSMSDNRDGAGAGDQPVGPATSENSETAAPPATGAKAEKSPFERRVFIFKAAFFLSGVAALGYNYYRQRRIREMTDNDPSDPRGGGRGSRRSKSGTSDNDPNDPEGGGKGQGRIVIQPKPDPKPEPKNQSQPGPTPDAAPKSETPPSQPKPDSNP